MLEPAVRYLACPHCRDPLTVYGGSLRCPAGHAYDIARQGYVSLLPPGQPGGVGDPAAMVQARERFLDAGHYAPLMTALADLARRHAPAEPGCVADVGAGTGHYLAAVLDRLPGRHGVALDGSKYALRRAARAHDRVGAIGCDIWRGLPIADRAAAVALDVFAPRNTAELRRILQPSGRLLVVTPTDQHLAELVSTLDLLTVDQRKRRRLAEQLGPYFDRVESHQVSTTMSLAPADIEALVAMGPSARHATAPDLAARVRRLPNPATITLSVTIGVYRPVEPPAR